MRQRTPFVSSLCVFYSGKVQALDQERQCVTSSLLSMPTHLTRIYLDIYPLTPIICLWMWKMSGTLHWNVIPLLPVSSYKFRNYDMNKDKSGGFWWPIRAFTLKSIYALCTSAECGIATMINESPRRGSRSRCRRHLEQTIVAQATIT